MVSEVGGEKVKTEEERRKAAAYNVVPEAATDGSHASTDGTHASGRPRMVSMRWALRRMAPMLAYLIRALRHLAPAVQLVTRGTKTRIRVVTTRTSLAVQTLRIHRPAGERQLRVTVTHGRGGARAHVGADRQAIGHFEEVNEVDVDPNS